MQELEELAAEEEAGGVDIIKEIVQDFKEGEESSNNLHQGLDSQKGFVTFAMQLENRTKSSSPTTCPGVGTSRPMARPLSRQV